MMQIRKNYRNTHWSQLLINCHVISKKKRCGNMLKLQFKSLQYKLDHSMQGSGFNFEL